MADYKLSYTGNQTDEAIGKAMKAVLTEAQNLTPVQQEQVRKNIGSGTSDFSGDYNDLENKPDLTGLQTQVTQQGKTISTLQLGVAQNARKIAELEKATPIDDASIATTTTWSSQHIVDTLCPAFSVKGNPAVCYPVAGSKLGVTASWEPTQEGTGTPSPDNIRPIHGRTQVKVERCGENLLNITPFTKETKKGITYEYVANGGIHISGTATAAVDSPTFAIGHLPPGKYYGINIDANIDPFIVVLRDGAKLWLTAKGVFEIRAGDVIRYWYMITSNGVTLDKTVYPYIVPGTSAPATHTPYIGSTTTITLPSTVYGGEVGADGEGQETWGYIESYAGEVVPAGWICDRAVYAEGATPPTGAQVAYKLAAPVPFTATDGGTIKALSGTNTILTDAVTLTVTGRADLIHTINALTNRVAALENAAANE